MRIERVRIRWRYVDASARHVDLISSRDVRRIASSRWRFVRRKNQWPLVARGGANIEQEDVP
jgi:hypothetical protein